MVLQAFRRLLTVLQEAVLFLYQLSTLLQAQQFQ